MFSRRRSREFLLQSLYSRSEIGESFNRDTFIENYFQEDSTILQLDLEYINTLEGIIVSNEAELISLISLLAPKFELSTMPVMHILILMIAVSEIIYSESLDVPAPVSINEAIELAKKFSDDQGKGFINGTLSTFIKDKDKFVEQSKSTNINFSVFHK